MAEAIPYQPNVCRSLEIKLTLKDDGSYRLTLNEYDPGGYPIEPETQSRGLLCSVERDDLTIEDASEIIDRALTEIDEDWKNYENLRPT
jgi:hypothetical protein